MYTRKTRLSKDNPHLCRNLGAALVNGRDIVGSPSDKGKRAIERTHAGL